MTLNDIELCIFANGDLLEQTFKPILEVADGSQAQIYDGVEISDDIWVALQIEQHGDGDFEDSGNRVKQIAQPLAAEGISILYCST